MPTASRRAAFLARFGGGAHVEESPGAGAGGPAPSSAGGHLDQRLRGARIAILDTETTGIDVREDRIVEIAVVTVDGLGLPGVEPVIALTTRVNPGIPIPDGAQRVHGITDADVEGSPQWPDVWPLVRAAVGDRIPVAFNAPFDARIIAYECARWDQPLGLLGWGGWIDPLILAKGLDKYERGRTLADVARRRSIDLDGHGGAGDAVASATVLRRLILEAVAGKDLGRGERFEAPPRPTLGVWLDWQRGVALAQERDACSYAQRQGRRDPVWCPWHELEGVALPPGGATLEQLRPVRPQPCSECSAEVVMHVARDGTRTWREPGGAEHAHIGGDATS